MKKPRLDERGFTLLELLVFLAIIALIVPAMAMTFYQALRTESAVVDDGLAINELRRGFAWLADDVKMASNTPLADGATVDCVLDAPDPCFTLTSVDQFQGARIPHSGSYALETGDEEGNRLVRIYDGRAHIIARRVLSVSFSREGRTIRADATVDAGPGATRTLSVKTVMRSTPDTGGPLSGIVNDGLLGDIDFQESTSTISANWTGFSDPGGIARYDWAIGTTPGATNVQDWTGIALATSATNSGLTLTDGQTYYVSVRAVDNTGNIGAPAVSDGLTVDTTDPNSGSVNDGTGGDVDYQFSTTTISANWSGFTDAGSGIARYEWAIGTTAGGTQVQPYTNVGLATSATNSGLTLTDGTKYYVSVRAIDDLEQQGLPADSDGVTVDTIAPTAGTVYDGPTAGVDIDFQTSTISANWSGFTDAESGIALYEWAIGTTAGGTQVQPYTNVGLASNVTRSGLVLTPGITYYISVQATDRAGNSTVANSDGFEVDTVGPTPGTVRDGTGGDIDFQKSINTISANWTGFSDGSGSGIARYDWAIGTTAGGTQVQGYTDVVLATSATNSGLTLTDGTTYYVSVRAIDRAGNSTVANSDGVKVDTVGPTPGTVRDGTGSDIDYQTSTTAISANWTGFSDGSGSGIARYEWAIGTTAGGTQMQSYTDVGLATSATNSGLTLTDGTKYFVSVRAIDNLEQQGPPAVSEGVTVDTTAPTAGTVYDGPTTGVDIDFQTSTSTIQANWTGFSDSAGIARYEWAISDGLTDVQGWTDVGLATSATNSGLPLTNGQTYYVSVRATDNLGNVGAAATSDGVTVDTTAPTAGTVYDGPTAGVDIDLQTSTSTISANWTGFSDGSGSGIARYEWAIGTTAGGTQVQGYTDVGLATSASNSGLTLTNGRTYYVSVRAIDNPGNTGAAAVSNGVTVDATAPTATILFPVAGGSYDSGAWGSGCEPDGICGTASDSSGSGLQKVEASIRRESSGLYWDGVSFSSAAPAFFEASLLASTTTYDFNGVLSPSASHKAEDGEIDVAGSVITGGAFPARRNDIAGWDPDLWDEATSAEYAQLLTSNDAYYQGADPGTGDNAAMLFEFAIAEAPSSITQIQVEVELAKGASQGAAFVYLWNYATNSYLVAGSMTGTLDQVVSFTITANARDYVNASGQLTVFIVNQNTGDWIRVDRISVSVTSVGNWSYAFPMANFPADGSYTVSARATDKAGNVGPASSATFTVDTPGA